MAPQFIVVYRPHNTLNCETQYYGPFTTFADAYEYSCGLPALGIQWFTDEDTCRNPGCKFVQELTPCQT